HRAPKTSKGDLVATSNFVNVTGAIAASLLFGGLVFAAKKLEIVPEVKQDERTGRVLKSLVKNKQHDWLDAIVLDGPNGLRHISRLSPTEQLPDADEDLFAEGPPDKYRIEVAENVSEGDRVDVSFYKLGDITYVRVRPAGTPLPPAYDLQRLPRYLFMGASLM